jgi:4'-phosphopantetheinyl transferase
MPLLLSKMINPYSAYAVWKISETPDQLLTLSKETPPEMHLNKRSEWMVTRILAGYLSNLFELRYRGVENLPSGKPILKDLQAEISITHSFPLAAVLINLRKSCGIDLELRREKLLKVQHKFLHEKESNYQGDTDKLCKIWAAKEVLFKVHGDKRLSFKDEMMIEIGENGRADGLILKDGKETVVPIRFEYVYDYLLCYSI